MQQINIHQVQGRLGENAPAGSANQTMAESLNSVMIGVDTAAQSKAVAFALRRLVFYLYSVETLNPPSYDIREASFTYAEGRGIVRTSSSAAALQSPQKQPAPFPAALKKGTPRDQYLLHGAGRNPSLLLAGWAITLSASTPHYPDLPMVG